MKELLFPGTRHRKKRRGKSRRSPALDSLKYNCHTTNKSLWRKCQDFKRHSDELAFVHPWSGLFNPLSPLSEEYEVTWLEGKRANDAVSSRCHTIVIEWYYHSPAHFPTVPQTGEVPSLKMENSNNYDN
jgi:hypothetical protein